MTTAYENYQPSWRTEFSRADRDLREALDVLDYEIGRLQQSIPAGSKSDIPSKIEYLRLQHDSYCHVMEELSTIELAQRKKARQTGQPADANVYSEMVGILSTMKDNVYCAVRQPPSSFAVLFQEACDWLAEHMVEIGIASTAVGGVSLAAYAAGYYAEYGYCILQYITRKYIFRMAVDCAVCKAAVGFHFSWMAAGVAGAVGGAICAIIAWTAYKQYRKHYPLPAVQPCSDEARLRKELEDAVAGLQAADPQDLVQGLQALRSKCVTNFGPIGALGEVPGAEDMPGRGDTPGRDVCAFCWKAFSQTEPAVLMPVCKLKRERHLAHQHCNVKHFRMRGRYYCILCNSDAADPASAAELTV